MIKQSNHIAILSLIKFFMLKKMLMLEKLAPLIANLNSIVAITISLPLTTFPKVFQYNPSPSPPQAT